MIKGFLFDISGVLLDGPEKLLNFPPIFIYCRYGGSTELKMVGQKYDHRLVNSIPNLDSAEYMGTIFLSLIAGKKNKLIRKNVPALWNRPYLFCYLIRVFFHPGNKIHASFNPKRV